MKFFQRCKAVLIFSRIALRVMFRNHYHHTKKAITAIKKLRYQSNYKESQNYID